MTIVCAQGYPGKYVKNKIIKNIKKIKVKKMNSFIMQEQSFSMKKLFLMVVEFLIFHI